MMAHFPRPVYLAAGTGSCAIPCLHEQTIGRMTAAMLDQLATIKALQEKVDQGKLEDKTGGGQPSALAKANEKIGNQRAQLAGYQGRYMFLKEQLETQKKPSQSDREKMLAKSLLEKSRTVSRLNLELEKLHTSKLSTSLSSDPFDTNKLRWDQDSEIQKLKETNDNLVRELIKFRAEKAVEMDKLRQYNDHEIQKLQRVITAESRKVDRLVKLEEEDYKRAQRYKSAYQNLQDWLISSEAECKAHASIEVNLKALIEEIQAQCLQPGDMILLDESGIAKLPDNLHAAIAPLPACEGSKRFDKASAPAGPSIACRVISGETAVDVEEGEISEAATTTTPSLHKKSRVVDTFQSTNAAATDPFAAADDFLAGLYETSTAANADSVPSKRQRSISRVTLKSTGPLAKVAKIEHESIEEPAREAVMNEDTAAEDVKIEQL